MVVQLDAGPALVQDKLADRVAARLRDAILGGTLRAGDTLRLVPLAERLGVSTTPVREALLLLQKEGLVTGEPRRGFRVAHLSRGDIRDLFQLFAFISGLLAERAAARISEDELEELARLSAEIRQVDAEGPSERSAILRQEFFRIVNRAAGPTILRRLLADMSRWTAPRVPGWPAPRLDHGPIVSALRRRDGRRARELVERHVLRAGHHVLTHLTDNGMVT